MEMLRELIAAQPGVYRPRMLLAVLTARRGDAPRALRLVQHLAAQNPASPEAMETLARVAAGADPTVMKQAAAARDQLLANNPDAQRQMGLFRDELDKGRWVYPARYGKPLPGAEKPGPRGDGDAGAK